METYSESAEGVLIDRARAATELARHGFTTAECLDECLAECRPFDGTDGVTRWDAGDVLRWLGY
jgi:hypothetical protein